ncbi:MAG: hypothetical protein EP344_19160 [Bacteroidetes bacterium]|nr:MAG: hypothetical protein EP344_19160 [Bacteroidota bacterium]
MPQQVLHPARVSARIWRTVVFLGPFVLSVIYEMTGIDKPGLPVLRSGQDPEFFQVYTILLIISILLSIVPYLITWGLVRYWQKHRLPDYLISERLFLLLALFTVVGIVGLMGRISLNRPLLHAMLLILPYSLTGGIGILWALGRPMHRKHPPAG